MEFLNLNDFFPKTHENQRGVSEICDYKIDFNNKDGLYDTFSIFRPL